MAFFMKNNDNFSLEDYKDILENYNSKFEVLFNLKEGMKIGKTQQFRETEEKEETEEPEETEETEEPEEPEEPEETEEPEEPEEPEETEVEKKKLMINGEYCIYDNNIYQKISRWWYSENREKTFGYLEKDFTKFVKYLDLIKIEVQSFNYIYYKKLSNNIKKLINKIIPGLYKLKKTYSEEKKIVAKVDSIILTLIDFKTEISKKKTNTPVGKSLLVNMYNQQYNDNAKKYNFYNEI